MTVKVIRGNIIEQDVDLIVNPLNSDIVFTRGIPFFVKKEGGDIIEKEALKYYPAKLGSHFITTAGRLKPKYILHFINLEFGKTVNYEILRTSFSNALKSVLELPVNTLALPPIYDKFSQYITAKIIKESIYEAFSSSNKDYSIKVVVFDEAAANIFKDVIES